MNVGPRDTAVRDIADDSDLEIVQARLALTDRERIEQSLCRMFVSAITAIDDRSSGERGQRLWSAGRGVPDNDTIRRHCIQRSRRIDQRFAFRYAAR